MDAAAVMLVELAQQVRGCTLRLLEDVPAPWLRWAPTGTANHILWHAGHVLWVQDVLIIEPLTGTSELPATWEVLFGQHGRSPAQTVDWPEREEVVRSLTDQLPRLCEVIAQADPQQLLNVAASAEGWNLPRGIIHGLHDEARHQGEIHLLKKLCRAR